MKTLIAIGFIASSLISGPGMLVTASGALAQGQCGPDAPKAWFRPGGFCAQAGSGNSLSTPVEPGCDPIKMVPIAGQVFEKGDRVTVAEACQLSYPCYPDYILSSVELKAGDRLRTALIECPVE
ncbi:MAG TPA: hypothetical protein PK286_02905 [Devosia sp.]|nr:hypothetical protein [Devosia sp.]